MKEVKVRVTSPSGLHLRPAQNLCRRAMEYESKVMIQFRNKEFNAKSLLGVLSACVQQDDEITLVCTGCDEEQAVRELAEYIGLGMK